MQVLKKLLLAFPVTLLVLFLMTGMAYAEGARTGIVQGNSVNVRANPNTSAEVVTQLSDGTKVSVIDSKGDWYKISASDSKGWIIKDYLKVSDKVISTGRINGEAVNVRSKPDISSDVLTKLDDGKKVDIYEHTGSWYRIGIGEGRYGWINKGYITVASSSTTRKAASTSVTKVSRGLLSDTARTVSADASQDQSGSEANASKDQSGSGDVTPAAADVSDLRQQVVAYAKEFLGVRYVYGGSTPDEGFDCSGFVSYVFKHFGISLDRTANGESQNGSRIDRTDLKPGDLVFFDTNGGHNSVNHVGIYIGDGQFIQASSGRSAHRVVISDLTSGFYDNAYMRSRDYISD